MSDSRKNLYDIGEETGSTGKIKRHRAVVKSTDTNVFFHRIDANPADLDLDDLIGKFRAFGRLRDPRVPSLIDAWQETDGIEFVLLEQDGFGINTDEGRQTIKNLNRDYGFEVSFQSLAALATLHQGNVTHRELKKECYVVHETGMFFLKDTGLLRQINEMLNPEFDGEGDFGNLMLASNLSGFDVADWACMIATIILGESILDPSLRAPGEEIQPEQVAMAQKAMISLMGEKPFSLFLKKCMQSRADNVGGFDNASEAIRNFPIEAMTK